MSDVTAIACLPNVMGDAWKNPYSAAMSLSLREHCEQIQRSSQDGHWASLRGELELARATLMDAVTFFSAMRLLPENTKDRIEIIMRAGQALRGAIKEVGTIARQAAQIESELREKHDPAITMQFISQTVKVIDSQLRQAEREGKVTDAEYLMQQITQQVDGQVRLGGDMPFGGERAGADVTPATARQTVDSMISTIPEVA